MNMHGKPTSAPSWNQKAEEDVPLQDNTYVSDTISSSESLEEEETEAQINKAIPGSGSNSGSGFAIKQ